MNEKSERAWLNPGPFSLPGERASLLRSIVAAAGPDPAALARATRGLMIHVFWRDAYGLPPEKERSDEEVNLRRLEEKLDRIAKYLERNAEEAPSKASSPISEFTLPTERRLIGNCRDFSLVYAALLREAGIPARSRCGFGMYFMPNHGEDHWVVERWTGTRWAVSDAQLDELMIERLGVPFDPMDLPDGQFLSGGEAWLACRAGDDPGRYGIFHMSGWDFVLGDFVRDVASLGGVELLPWDMWGVMLKGYANLSPADLETLDSAARSTPMRAGFGRGDAERLASSPLFAPGRRIKSWRSERLVEVDLYPGS